MHHYSIRQLAKGCRHVYTPGRPALLLPGSSLMGGTWPTGAGVSAGGMLPC
jgi:hypothetical protein